MKSREEIAVIEAQACYAAANAAYKRVHAMRLTGGPLFNLYFRRYAETTRALRTLTQARIRALLPADRTAPLPQYTSVGCYTILYERNGECFCAKCARHSDRAATYDEGETLECAKCGHEIESSYGPVE